MTDGRNEWATKTINERGYALGVEIGVREGSFSRHLLKTTDIRLDGIDPYICPSAMSLVREYPGRFALRMAMSPAAAEVYPDGTFDFVHIDADHSYAATAADLAAWWPKLKPGGCFSGDDYADTDNPGEGKYGVVRAVNEFVDRNGLELFVYGAADQTRESQLAFAKFNGEQASNYLRGKSYLPFQNPVWYLFKEAK